MITLVVVLLMIFGLVFAVFLFVAGFIGLSFLPEIIQKRSERKILQEKRKILELENEQLRLKQQQPKTDYEQPLVIQQQIRRKQVPPVMI